MSVIIDSELYKAAESGDIEFLSRAVTSKIPGNEDYFLAHQHYHMSNIFHIATFNGKVEFVREALKILPTHLVLQLLSDQQHRYGWNPLHDAVSNGRTEILMSMLGFYKSYSGEPLVPNDINHPHNKPWLALTNKTDENNTTKQTPLQLCILRGREDCAMEIMEMDMDMELLCNVLDEDGNSLLFLAVQKKFNRVAEKILNSDCSYKNGDTPLHMAISSKLEHHALHFLSVKPSLSEVINDRGESPLFAAVRNGCEQVVKEIMRIHPNPNYTMLRCNDGQTLLHLLQSCSEETGRPLLGKFWWMINMRDAGGRTALDEAKIADLPWLVNLLINPSSIQKEPFDWIKACKHEETWAIMAFIDSCDDLEEVCRKENDTPLHHIQLDSYKDCQNFLKIPSIKELKNTTDRDGATPLHRALERNDIHLAKALLVDTEVERNIVDDTGNTALSLLVDLCRNDDEWAKMCREIKVNPYLKTTYIQARTNLEQMRNTLSVVAALLATITFAAAFTLPGGLNSATGYGMLAKRVSFLVFLLADAYAICTSILVLFCLIWSMISEREMSYFLVDRSVLILMQSLYGTLIAFMTGIYVVIAHDSLWAAIIVLVLCSLIGISVNRTVLRRYYQHRRKTIWAWSCL